MVSKFRHPDLFGPGPVFPGIILIVLSRPFGIAFQCFKALFSLKKILSRTSFKGYTPTEKDVIVATSSKSGTNWTLQMALLIANKGKPVEFEHIHDVVPWPDVPFQGIAPLKQPGMMKAAPTEMGFRVIKTFLDPDMIPYNKGTKYITILRDPKEILVSAYFFIPSVFGIADQVTPQMWLDYVLQNGRLASELAEHQAHTWDRRDLPNWLVLRFDEIKKDHRGHVQKIAAHMGVDLKPEEIQRVVEQSSFEYMRANEDKFGPPIFPLVSNKKKAAPVMIRSGKTGKTSELLTPVQMKQIDDFMLNALSEMNSTFPYHEYFRLQEVKDKHK